MTKILRKSNVYLNLFDKKRNHKKELQKFIVFSKRDKYYQLLEIVINYLLENSENKDNYNFIRNIIISFLINHGYFYYKIGDYLYKKSEEFKLFWDLSLNNYNLLSNLQSINIEKFDNDFYLYYLSYLLRIGITDFITNREESIIHNMLSNNLYDFENLNHLIEVLNESNNNYLEYKNINNNINEFFNYLINEEKKLEKQEIIKYLDIGTSLSLFLISYYFNKNYFNKTIMNTFSLLDLFQKLYFLCNLLSSSFIETFSYNKKLLLFSLFTVFNVTPIPSNNKILNLLNNKNFQSFNSINGALLNCNSILLYSNFTNSNNKFKSKYFDIFYDGYKYLFSENNNKFEMFNSEGNNIIINYNILPTLFRLILSNTIMKIFENSYDSLAYTPNLFSDEVEYLKEESHYYSSILYFYNQLNFSCYDSLSEFWTNLCKNFSNIRNYFPREKTNEEVEKFFLNDYLKDLMLFNDAY